MKLSNSRAAQMLIEESKIMSAQCKLVDSTLLESGVEVIIYEVIRDNLKTPYIRWALRSANSYNAGIV